MFMKQRFDVNASDNAKGLKTLLSQYVKEGAARRQKFKDKVFNVIQTGIYTSGKAIGRVGTHVHIDKTWWQTLNWMQLIKCR